MGGMACVCRGGAKCSFYGYPAICKDCKRNSMAKKDAHLDLYKEKDFSDVVQGGIKDASKGENP